MLSFLWQSQLTWLLCVFSSFFSMLLVPLILESSGHPCSLQLVVYLPCHHERILKYIQSLSPESYVFLQLLCLPYTPRRWAGTASSNFFDLPIYRYSLLFLGLFYFFTLNTQPRTLLLLDTFFLSLCQVFCMCDYICLWMFVFSSLVQGRQGLSICY